MFAALNNGTDIEMGGTIWTYNLSSALKGGLVQEKTLDAAVRRSYLPHFRAGRFDPVESVEWTSIGIDVVNSSAHQAIQWEAALQVRGLRVVRGYHLLMGSVGACAASK